MAMAPDRLQRCMRLAFFLCAALISTTFAEKCGIHPSISNMLACVDITNVTAELPRDQPYITSLWIDNSTVPKISLELMQRFPAITFLRVSNSSVEFIDENAFEKNPQLTNVDFRPDNKFKIFPARIFMKSSITVMDLDGNRELVIPKNKPFLESENFESLSLNSCNITKIYLETFEKLPALGFISLEENFLETLPEDVFRGNRQLLIVQLNSNRFKFFNPKIFMFLYDENLRASFQGNPWHCGCELTPFLLWSRRKGEEIKCATPTHMNEDDLMYPQFCKTAIGASKCEVWENSDLLACSYALESEIPKSVQPKIGQIEFTDSKIPRLGANLLKIYPKLYEAKISVARVEIIDEDAFNFNADLNKIDLSKNRITTVPTYLVNKTKIMYLALNENKGLVMPERKPFLVSNKLQILSLRECDILNLYPETFEKLPELRELFLHGNRLSTLADDIFSRNTHLEYLYMDHNNFSFLSDKPFKPLLKLISATYHDNPWVCDCKLTPLLKWSGSVAMYQVNGIKCSVPKGKTWESLGELKLC